jgi:hypothetical protein
MVVRWSYSLLGWRRNPSARGLLIGLLGNQEHEPSQTDWLVGQLTAFAARANMDFTRHTASEVMFDGGWMTPIVEKLCRRMGCPNAPTFISADKAIQAAGRSNDLDPSLAVIPSCAESA